VTWRNRAARRLSRATMRNIRQNLFSWLLYNASAGDCRRGALPWTGLLLEPDDRGRRDERELGVGRPQRVETAPRRDLTDAPRAAGIDLWP